MATSEFTAPPAFPRIAVLTCVAATLELAILSNRLGFEAPARFYELPAELIGPLVAIFVMYRYFRDAPVVAYLTGGLALVLWSCAANAYLAIVAAAAAFPLQDDLFMRLSEVGGFSHFAMIEWIARRPAIGTFLNDVYLLTVPILFLSLVVLALTRQFERLRTVVTLYGFMLTGCVTISMFVPALGYMIKYPLPAELTAALPDGAGTYYGEILEQLRNGTVRTLAPEFLKGVVVFPSFHAAMAMISAYALWRTRFVGVANLLLSAITGVSIIPMGGHYLVDIVGSVAMFAIALPVSRAFGRLPAEGAVDDMAGFRAAPAMPAA